MPPLPPVTQALMLINVAVFCLGFFLGPWFGQLFALWPIGGNFLPWQVVTYAFLHADVVHLLFNLLGLWMFGSELERLWGQRRFIQFFTASVLAAAASQLLLAPLLGAQAPTVGASGGIFGLLLAYGMTFPDRTIMLLIPPVPMKAITMVWVYGLLELYVLLPPYVPGVGLLNYLFGNAAHLAHLGGMLGGFLMIRFWRGAPPFSRRRR